MTIDYPVVDLEEQWAGFFQDPAVNADKVWAAGYTSTGFYVYAHGRRGGTLNSRRIDCHTALAAKARFDQMVAQKSNQHGYQACEFGASPTYIPSFGVPRLGNYQTLLGRRTPIRTTPAAAGVFPRQPFANPGPAPRVTRRGHNQAVVTTAGRPAPARAQAAAWHDPEDFDAWDPIVLRLLASPLNRQSCPLCPASTLRTFFTRRPSGAGHYWIWCPTCRAYESGAGTVPTSWPDRFTLPAPALGATPADLDAQWQEPDQSTPTAPQPAVIIVEGELDALALAATR